MSGHLKDVSVEGRGDGKPFIYIDDVKGLVALVQMGTIELHAWNATVDSVKTPDRLIFDLDPGPDVPWAAVKQAARDLRARLGKLGLVAFLKTTGGKGLHVVVPFRRGPDWAAAKEFARTLASAMASDEPDRFTVNSRKQQRKGRIFIDYLRNDETASAVTAYSVRARPGAPVSLPIDWKQLARLQSGDAFGMKQAVNQRGDPWRAMAQAAKQSLPAPGSARPDG
jgi:bifunctional non-homologous end joining protein LigD